MELRQQLRLLRSRWWLLVASVLITGAAAFLVYQRYIVDDILSRIIVISLVLAAGCVTCAYELLRGPARTLRVPAVLAAVLFALVASTLTFRAISTIVFGLSRFFPLSLAAYMVAGMSDYLSVVMRSTAIQLTAAAGSMAKLSVRMIPVRFETSKRSKRIAFSV